MTTEITSPASIATPDDAARMTASWPDLLRRPVATDAEASEIRAGLDHLRKPAPRKWLLGRVTMMLSHYYVAQADEALVKGIAEDWAWELNGLPAWAVSNAVRWWMSGDNPDRRKKPMPGDISEQARKEMAALTVAEVALRRYDRGGNIIPFQPEPQPERLTAEERQKRADEIMAAAGFAVKRFPEVGEGSA